MSRLEAAAGSATDGWQGLQAAFAAAVRDPDRAPPEAVVGPVAGQIPATRFAVYRNTYVVSLTEALASIFPVVKALVGEAFFAALARAYIAAHPPRSPVLIHYGDRLDELLSAFPPATGLPFLPDVARLERAVLEATHSGDAPPLTIDALAALPAESVGTHHLSLHPSVRLVSSQWPIVSLWSAHQSPDPAATLSSIAKAAETALVVRPALTTHVHRCAPAAAAFTSALQAGLSLDAAVGQLAEGDRDGLGEVLATLFAAGAIAGIERAEHHTDGEPSGPSADGERA